MKRSSCEYNEALKRARGPLVGAGRLCDLNTAVDLFSDVANAEAAKEKGWLGAKKAKEKYEEVRAHHAGRLVARARTRRMRAHARARPARAAAPPRSSAAPSFAR